MRAPSRWIPRRLRHRHWSRRLPQISTVDHDPLARYALHAQEGGAWLRHYDSHASYRFVEE